MLSGDETSSDDTSVEVDERNIVEALEGWKNIEEENDSILDFRQGKQQYVKSAMKDSGFQRRFKWGPEYKLSPFSRFYNTLVSYNKPTSDAARYLFTY